MLRIMGRGLGAGVGFGPGYVCFRACAFPTQQKLGFREGDTQLLAPAQPSSADSQLHAAGSERTWPYLITDWWWCAAPEAQRGCWNLSDGPRSRYCRP